MKKTKQQPLFEPHLISQIIQANQPPRRAIGWGQSIFESQSADLASVTQQLFCTKCSHSTSGLVTPGCEQRRCPQCSSVLMYCPICRRLVSATEKFKVLRCDGCESDFVTASTIEHLVSMDKSAREIVLSGVRATGKLHLGNYVGAMSQFVQFEGQNNLCLYFIADWHTLTTFQKSDQVSKNVLEIATDYLAAGLNPERSIIYTQSSIPEIAELALYLSMFQSKQKVEAMPTIKDIVKGGVMTMGHLFYPVLMAADILGPQATVVPVGPDQKANVELARDLATKFNSTFGQTFVVPRESITSKRVPGLGGGKMGKSEADNAIGLTDSLAEITAKYRKYGITDDKRVTATSPGNPSNCKSVFPMFSILLESDPEALEIVRGTCMAGTRGCASCKDELSKRVDALIAPFRERREQLKGKESYVKDVLHYGGIKARELIQPTLDDVRQKLGIV